MVAVLKTAFAFLANVGSNPTPSANWKMTCPCPVSVDTLPSRVGRIIMKGKEAI